MMYTSIDQVKEAIRNGDITEGMTYTTTAGMFQIIDLDGNDSDIIGHIAEMEIDENGDAEPMDESNPITAADLMRAEF